MGRCDLRLRSVTAASGVGMYCAWPNTGGGGQSISYLQATEVMTARFSLQGQRMALVKPAHEETIQIRQRDFLIQS